MMRELYIASQADKVIDMLDQRISFANKKVGFLRTAATVYSDESWVEKDRNLIRNTGAELIDIDIEVLQGEELKKILLSLDILYVEGGNIYHLLKYIRESGFDKILDEVLDAGVIYIGSSAGSVVVGSYTDAVLYMERPEYTPDLEDLRGLGIIDAQIVPHRGKEEYKQRYQDKGSTDIYNDAHSYIVIPDSQVLYIQGDTRKFLDAKKN